MQHMTNATERTANELVSRISQHIDTAKRVHIIWDIHGIISGETTILHPVTEIDADSRRLGIVDASDIESTFSVCYGVPELMIEEDKQPGCYSISFVNDTIECWFICEF